MPALARLAVSALAAASAALAASRSTWQEETRITNPYAECAPYGYAPVDAVLPNYPTIWATASLSHPGALAADKALFDKIKNKIPNIKPKGTRDGDFSSVSYDYSEDPDCWWSATLCTDPKVKGLPDDITSCPEANTWGFTLDDGPNCSHNAYYDYLNDIQQKATMFFIGSNVLDWPLEAQRALADGHEICSHTWSHPYMTSMTNEEAFAELYYSKKAIHDVTGVTVSCWRPPYGDVDDRIRYIAEQLEMRTIIWDNDTDDWNYASIGVKGVEANYKKIMNGDYKKHGTIVLSHEIDGETMKLSEQYLPQIRKKFDVMPVGTCQNWTQPYGEGDKWQYPNHAQWIAGTRSVKVSAPTAYSKEVAFGTHAVVTSSGLPRGVATNTASTKKTTTTKKASSTKKTTTTTKNTFTKKKPTTTKKKSTRKAIAKTTTTTTKKTTLKKTTKKSTTKKSTKKTTKKTSTKKTAAHAKSSSKVKVKPLR